LATADGGGGVAAPTVPGDGMGTTSADVNARYTTTASTTSSAASQICFWRSVAIGLQTVVRRELDGERQRLGRIVLRQRDVVDDHEFRRAFQLVDELPQVFIVALQLGADLQPPDARVLLRRLD